MTPRPLSAPAGVAAVLRQGLAHWLELRGTLPPAPRPRPATVGAPTTPDIAGANQRRTLIAVLATLVAQAQQEVAR